MKNKYKWVKESTLDEMYKESSHRLQEIHRLRKEIEELNKKLYPFSMNNEPQIMDMNMQRLTLELALSIGEYKDLSGNHIIIKDFTDHQEYRYYIDYAGFRSRDNILKIIETFFSDLMTKYGVIE